MIDVVDLVNPETEMDKAMYGVIKVFHVSVVKNQYGGTAGAQAEIEYSMAKLVGEGLWAECDVLEEGRLLSGIVRIFRDEEGLRRWQADAPLREVAERHPEKRW